MNENEPITQWEDRFTEDKEEVANMDKDNLLNLLMESRIIQASCFLEASFSIFITEFFMLSKLLNLHFESLFAA